MSNDTLPNGYFFTDTEKEEDAYFNDTYLKRYFFADTEEEEDDYINKMSHGILNTTYTDEQIMRLRKHFIPAEELNIFYRLDFVPTFFTTTTIAFAVIGLFLACAFFNPFFLFMSALAIPLTAIAVGIELLWDWAKVEIKFSRLLERKMAKLEKCGKFSKSNDDTSIPNTENTICDTKDNVPNYSVNHSFSLTASLSHSNNQQSKRSEETTDYRCNRYLA